MRTLYQSRAAADNAADTAVLSGTTKATRILIADEIITAFLEGQKR